MWAVAAGIILCTALFSSAPLARAATVGALFCGINFTVGRIALSRMLLQKGQGQRAFALLYASKFGFLVAVLGVLTLVMKLDVLGLIIGFSALPMAMYLLLFVRLLKRPDKTE